MNTLKYIVFLLYAFFLYTYIKSFLSIIEEQIMLKELNLDKYII